MIEVSGIDSYYGKAHILKQVSLEVHQGEIVALIGANGAGKSTTLRTISGMIHPARGTIAFDGRRIEHLSSPKVARLGLCHVPEGRKVFPDLTVEENLDIGGFVLGKDKKRLESLKAKVYGIFPRLAERRLQMAGTLSGGEQQMLAIGRGIMSDPRAFLMDEPSLGLAPMLIEEIFRVIVEMNRNGATILLVEQNAALALTVAGRAYVLENGRVTLEGAAPALLENPQVREAYLGGA